MAPVWFSSLTLASSALLLVISVHYKDLRWTYSIPPEKSGMNVRAEQSFLIVSRFCLSDNAAVPSCKYMIHQTKLLQIYPLPVDDIWHKKCTYRWNLIASVCCCILRDSSHFFAWKVMAHGWKIDYIEMRLHVVMKEHVSSLLPLLPHSKYTGYCVWMLGDD